MEQKRIFIAEDHTILREGLRALLSSQPDLQVIGEAADGLEAIRAVDQLAPDLVLMDLSMPRMNGLEAIAEIKRRCPSTKVLVLTVHRTEEYVLATFRAGANGYVLKTAQSSDLLRAVKQVAAGKSVLDPEIAPKVIANMAGARSVEPLSQRELDVVRAAAKGWTNREIAQALDISDRTVQGHLANIFAKLQVSSRTEVVTLALQTGLITLEDTQA